MCFSVRTYSKTGLPTMDRKKQLCGKPTGKRNNATDVANIKKYIPNEFTITQHNNSTCVCLWLPNASIQLAQNANLSNRCMALGQRLQQAIFAACLMQNANFARCPMGPGNLSRHMGTDRRAFKTVAFYNGFRISRCRTKH